MHLEPNFGKKCNELVYDKCNGVVWHVSKKDFEKYITHDGIKPRAGKNYRMFSERVFLSCGETSQEIIDNVKFLLKQLAIPEGEYMEAINTRWPENGNEMIDIINEFHSKYEV